MEQKPVYFTSKLFIESEARYNSFEKISFSLWVIEKKLRLYFQAHQIPIFTTYPITAMLQKTNLSRRLLKWAVELSEYRIRFKPRITIKAQALADFVTKLGPTRSPESIEEWWQLKTNGSTRKTGASVDIILQSPDDIVITRVVRFAFSATNNEDEYEALILGLRLALAISIENVEAMSKSQLVVSQVNGSYEAKNNYMESCELYASR